MQALAQNCHEQFGHQCDQLTVIFPNKRAGVYFADHLAQLYDQPVWSPTILSFEEFVEGKQEKNFADDLQMIFILYQAYQRIVKQPEDFDAFFPWGEMILKDFNDIDNYLVDVQHIFRVIKSQKELDEAFRHLSEQDQQTIQNFWKGFLPTPNKKQHEFIATWSILAELYELFNQLLAEKGLIYKGRMFREFAEQKHSLELSQSIWFAGFNALTKAEEQIIKSYLDQHSADIFWDVDNYYFQDKNQESGEFFRQYELDALFRPGIHRDLKNSIQNDSLQLNVLSAPMGMGQIKGAIQMLGDQDILNSNLSQTLIVLTDESLLQPLLSALPESVDNFNVTMGWSVAQSRIFILLLKIIRLHEKYDPKNHAIHLKEVIGLLTYHDLLDISTEEIHEFESSCIEQNTVYPSYEVIVTHFPALKAILSACKDVMELTVRLTSFVADIKTDELSDIEKSAIVLIHGTLKRLNKALDHHDIALGFASFHKLFQKLGTTIKLPLSGDPKQGVQVMGILETRNLSFENVFIIGMNEGHWPKDSSNTSFIPYNIRKAFDLPTIEHQDAMQSYLFYRLLHSTKRMLVTYNNISEFNHNGEPSRYIRQLKYESGLDVHESMLVSPVVAQTDSGITIEKNADIARTMRRYLSNGGSPEHRLSPSALNTYIDCKLRFYFQHIEGIKEPDELLEDMDPSLFGNLLHGAMEHLYSGKKLWAMQDVGDATTHLDDAIRQSFEDQKISNEEFRTGRQMIAYEVIKAYMEQILAFDQQHAPFEIKGLETKDYFVDFPIETMQGDAKVGLKGIIDRIDEYAEVTRVLDYKSGRDERKFGPMYDLIDGKSSKRNKAVFQLFYYCMLYKANHPDQNKPIQPGLFNSKDLFSNQFDTLLTQSVDRKSRSVLDYGDFEEEFTEVLGYLLTEIFNTEVPFTQTEDEQKCQYCTYKNICNKG